MTREPLVKIYQAQGIFAAEVVKSKLEANGIPALLKYEAIGQIIGITVDGLGRVEVYVPAEQAEQAMRLVEEGGDDEGEPPAGGESADVPAGSAPTDEPE